VARRVELFERVERGACLSNGCVRAVGREHCRQLEPTARHLHRHEPGREPRERLPKATRDVPLALRGTNSALCKRRVCAHIHATLVCGDRSEFLRGRVRGVECTNRELDLDEHREQGYTGCARRVDVGRRSLARDAGLKRRVS
jgi:hypothetical protein